MPECMYVNYMCTGTLGARRGYWISWNWSNKQVVESQHVGARNQKSGSSARALGAFNCLSHLSRPLTIIIQRYFLELLARVRPGFNLQHNKNKSLP